MGGRAQVGVVMVVTLAFFGCLSFGCLNTPCDASYPSVDLDVPGGPQALASYRLSGACTGAGTGADCRLFTGTTPPRPCYLHVRVKRPDSGSNGSTSTCHIELVSNTGGVFAVDVETVDRSVECANWSLADPSQSTIIVEFANGDASAGN
jgi:hypothetical protein